MKNYKHNMTETIYEFSYQKMAILYTLSKSTSENISTPFKMIQIIHMPTLEEC